MTLFVLTALCFTLFTLWLAVRPLLSKGEASTYHDGENANIQFLRSRMVELEQQHASGKLDAEQFGELKQELESNLALEIAATAEQQANRHTGESKQDQSSARKYALILALVLPLSTGVIYYFAGNHEVVSLMAEQKSQEPQFDMDEVSAMIAGVEQRLEATPDDLEGWYVLSRVYLGTGRYSDAENAFLQILRLEGPSAVTFASLADASALAAQGQLSGKPMEYVNLALALDPQQPQALWLAGLNAAQMGDNQTAKTYWTQLLPLLSDIPERQAELRDILAQIDAESAETAPQAIDQTDSEPVVANTVADADAKSGPVRVDVAVTIQANVLANLSASTPIFVFARAVGGPPAPLAVKRFTLASLPELVSLSDADAMFDSMTISRFDEVEISARASLSGTAVASRGDFEATPQVVSTSSRSPVNLVINQEVN